MQLVPFLLTPVSLILHSPVRFSQRSSRLFLPVRVRGTTVRWFNIDLTIANKSLMEIEPTSVQDVTIIVAFI